MLAATYIPPPIIIPSSGGGSVPVPDWLWIGAVLLLLPIACAAVYLVAAYCSDGPVTRADLDGEAIVCGVLLGLALSLVWPLTLVAGVLYLVVRRLVNFFFKEAA